jgi:hypothetical protein
VYHLVSDMEVISKYTMVDSVRKFRVAVMLSSSGKEEDIVVGAVTGGRGELVTRVNTQTPITFICMLVWWKTSTFGFPSQNLS